MAFPLTIYFINGSACCRVRVIAPERTKNSQCALLIGDFIFVFSLSEEAENVCYLITQ